MLLRANQFASQLKNKLPPVVWISGDEPLLVQEACDTVRDIAREQGFTEREVYHTNAMFDWNVLLESASNLSLFADRKLIDLRLHSVKLENDAKTALQTFAADPGDDNVMLITSAKLDKPTLSTKWFKAIEGHGVAVQIWPVKASELPDWVAQRMKRVGLKADHDSINIICQRVEGNLLAAAQEVDKLFVLAGDKPLTPDIVARAVADNSRFNVFGLIDACLAGTDAKALTILNHLRAEGDDPLKILHFVTKEIRNLLRMREKIQSGQNVNGVMQAERVWQNRTGIVGNALRTHTIASLEYLLLRARNVDQSVKGMLDRRPWDELACMTLELAGSTATTNMGRT